MLHFDREHGRWYLVTGGGKQPMKAIPVINDDEIGFVPTMVVPFDGGQAIVN
jgi:hypothetical protein